METILDKQPYEERMEYGGFWIRFAAYIIDSIIIGVPLLIVTLIIFMLFFGGTGALDLFLGDPYATELSDEDALLFLGSYLGALGISLLINIVGAVAYFAGLHASKWQATVGKKLLGLKVTDLKGNRISFWRALGRYLAMSFLSGILLIGFIIAAFTEKKQSLHDLIAGTTVIKK
ncbi:RDD family protein [Bacillus sp. DTU_2020_1000418_1_SI_GHA_SEK_038]|uniref:RDD family protein n=1 Tax=Bacillus sp. DTU_2020_1000418_1_SI_GHA_SEK_038 TaxID=3077585 RepID=UPI0028EA9849|nr:RDD family protein [Bacillus sp. DTU_2020_1000418_1_SI_GHA_SEK_038]WNS76981.1 RDD family protein [Bacillus sp. DTU_2020_1000418_1_SI_GHA_SEK_038]